MKKVRQHIAACILAVFCFLLLACQTFPLMDADDSRVYRSLDQSRVPSGVEESPDSQSDFAEEDREIARLVKQALLADPVVRAYRIAIQARDGRVYLSGTVGSPFERSRAREIAAQVSGVREVVDRLDDPTRWTWDQDWDLRKRIERAFLQEAGIDVLDVKVTVTDGVATLRGTVARPETRRYLTDLARTSGARDVRDDLDVRSASSLR